MEIEDIVMAASLAIVTGVLIYFLIRYPKIIILAVIVFPVITLACIMLGPLGWLSWLIFIGMVIRYTIISRYNLTMHVFSTIGASMRQNLPLSTALATDATGMTGKYRQVMNRIANGLTAGLPLSEAIRQGYPTCPGYALAMITSSERIQQVPQAIARIEQDLQSQARESRKVQPVNPAYPVAVVFFAMLILASLLVFILPKFEVIFADMGEKLPWITRIIMHIADEFGVILWIFFLLLFFVVTPICVYVKFRPRRADKPKLFSRIGDWVKWHTPVLHWFERNYATLQTVSFLKMSLNANVTVNKAITETEKLDVNYCYRKKLAKWLGMVTSGENISDAARRCGVGSQIAWAFDQNVNPGNTPAVLDSLESFYSTNYGYLANLARYIFWPCLIITLGLFVGTIVYALFSPMVEMINIVIRDALP